MANDSSDLIRGCSAIGDYLGGQSARQVRHLAYGGARLPVFKLGRAVCARRSTLDAWIAAQEAAGRAGGE